MAQQTINVGASANDGTGTPLRTAFQYTNSNFSELYTAVGPSGNNIVVPGNATITGDLTVATSVLKVDTANTRVGINTTLINGGPFNVKISPTIDAKFVVQDGFTTGNVRLAAVDNAYSTYKVMDYSALSHTWYNSGSTAMTLNSTGLGVGTATHSVKLGVVDAGNTFAATFRGNGGTNFVAIGTTGFGASINAYTAGFASAADLVLQPNGGNVGIGITPSAWSLGKALNVNSLDGAVLWGYSGVAVFGNNFRFSGGYLYETTAAASRYSQSSGSHEWFTAPSGTAGNAITFTQAMTLDASGNLLVGTTTNTNLSRVFSRGTATSSALALQGASGDVSLAQLTVGKFDNNSTTSQILVRFTINDNTSGSGQINANGASQAAFGTFSDSRLKENIVSLPSQLANILSLRPVEFDYKDGSGHQIGFVAQEMQEVYSDAVGEQEGFLTVTGWSKTEARLVSAIKELAAKVQALEAKLA